MARILPFAIIGLAITILGFAISSGIVTFIGGITIAAGVLWFLLKGTSTPVDRQLHER